MACGKFKLEFPRADEWGERSIGAVAQGLLGKQAQGKVVSKKGGYFGSEAAGVVGWA
jgi:hypothetical protein